ncbi:MAG: ribosome-associated translation inhibitor RaiA [Candidatus Omnitrophica bacterium]|nr:ribosome-associated translation inhibitor RaiA [Candidatus Omnitrophota bacterium]
MPLVFTARHCELSAAVRQRAAKKVDKMNKYIPAMTGSHLVVTREKSRYEAELVITAKRLRVVGKAQAMDPATAVEDAVDRVAQQLRKDHARRQDQRLRKAHAWAQIRKSGRGQAAAPPEIE